MKIAETQVEMRHHAIELWKALWPCAFYLSCSLSMNIFTKTIITSYGWSLVYTLAAAQNVFTFAVLYIGKYAGLVDVPTLAINTSFFWKVAVPLAAINSANIITGFMCMKLVNIPMYIKSII